MSPGLFDDFHPRPSTRGESFAPIPVCWPTLSDAEAQARLDELADWTSWLLERYALDYRTIRPAGRAMAPSWKSYRHCAPDG